jgi:hypothetical protein
MANSSGWMDPGTAQANGYYPASPSLAEYDSNGASPGGVEMHWQNGNGDFGPNSDDLQAIIVETSCRPYDVYAMSDKPDAAERSAVEHESSHTGWGISTSIFSIYDFTFANENDIGKRIGGRPSFNFLGGTHRSAT